MSEVFDSVDLYTAVANCPSVNYIDGLRCFAHVLVHDISPALTDCLVMLPLLMPQAIKALQRWRQTSFIGRKGSGPLRPLVFR